MQTIFRTGYFQVEMCYVHHGLIGVRNTHTINIEVVPSNPNGYAGCDSWSRLELDLTKLVGLVNGIANGDVGRCFLYYPYIRPNGTAICRNYTLLPHAAAVTCRRLELNRPNVYVPRTPVDDSRRCLGRLFVEVAVNNSEFAESGPWSSHFQPHNPPYLLWDEAKFNFIAVVAVDDPANLQALHPNHRAGQIEYYTGMEEAIDMKAAANSNGEKVPKEEKDEDEN
jgi:hypothetical protein